MRPLPHLDQLLTRAALDQRTPGYRWTRANECLLAGFVGEIDALPDREGIVGTVGPGEVRTTLAVVDGGLESHCSAGHSKNPHRCHHAAALGLAYLARRSGTDEEGLTAMHDRPGQLREALHHLPREALAQVLLDCASSDPGLADRLILLHRGHGAAGVDLRAYRGALERAIPRPGASPSASHVPDILRHAEHFVSAVEDLAQAGYHAAVLTLCGLSAPRLEAAYGWSNRHDDDVANLQERLGVLEKAARCAGPAGWPAEPA